ncbi:MAG: heme ABC transporter ATP-binding protein [Paracoccaceae bacterium]
MLEICNLSARIDRHPILRDVTLTVRPGEVLAICGPNGAGKSTLLRAALGEMPATSGRVSLNGLDIAGMAPARMARLRAVLPQDTQVAFAFSVAEIVAMGQEAGDFAADAGLVARALAAVGLGAHAGRAFHTLSGGERQRTHLARALAQVWGPVGPDGARWLFLDEPVASLDLGHQLTVLRLARGFADAGGGVVAVMHDLNLSAMFADRMAFVVEGALVADGPPHEVMRADLLERAYGCRVAVNRLPATGPWLLPQACGPV